MRSLRNSPAIAAVLLGLAILVTIAPSTSGAVSPGQSPLDPTFGEGGRVFVQPPSELEPSNFSAVAREPDGRLVLEVDRVPRTGRELEMRLPDGSLDPSFGTEGRLSVAEGHGVATLADGDILLGVDRCGGGEGSVMMLDASGSPVPSFGQGGCGARIGFAEQRVLVDPQGRILVGGTKAYCPCGKNGYSTEVVVARLLADGSLDPSFGDSGKVGTHADIDGVLEETSYQVLKALAAAADGGVLISAGEGGLIRLHPDGRLDTGFGKRGVVHGPARSYAGPVVAQADGSIELISVEPLEDGFLVSKFSSDGAVETEFGSGGTARLPALSSFDTDETVAAAAPAGGLLIGSREASVKRSPSGLAEVLLVRLTASGQPDPAYGEGGIARLGPPGTGSLVPYGLGALSVAGDGSALLAGSDFDEDAVLASRSATGAADPAFGEGGPVTEHRERQAQLQPTGLALAPGGGLALSSTLSDPGDVGGYLSSLEADGGGEGQTTTEVIASGILVPVTGGFVVWDEYETRRRHVIHAIAPDGAPLASFGEDGTARFPARFVPQRVEPSADGGCVLVGSNGSRSMVVLRLGPDGMPLAGFGHHGRAEIPFGRKYTIAYDALVEADGDTVVTGWVGGDFGAARLRPDGTLDRGFGRQGLVRGLPGPESYGRSIVSWPAGGVVIGTVSEPRRQTKSTGLVRLDPRGRLVSGFGRRGVVHIDTGYRPRALLVSGERIVTVANPPPSPGRGRAGVEVRVFRADGAPDGSFARAGVAVLGRGDEGQPPFTPAAAVAESAGQIVVAGTAYLGDRHTAAELLRLVIP